MDGQQKYRVYVCGSSNCSGRGSGRLHEQLEAEIYARRLDGLIEVRVGGCQDQCDYGPNMIIWPGPFRYFGLTAEALSQIVEQHLLGGQPVQAYLATPHMRR